MLPIGLILLLLALATGVLALRGRVVARGRFCRRCRFDLAGLTDPATCPECGRDLARPGSVRPRLRRASRLGLALAAVLLVAGISVTAVAATDNTARLFAALPDRVVLTLHALGADAAFTEIVTNRLMPPDRLPDAVWEALIEEALALQADESRAWDARHGEVLSVAMSLDRLTDKQATAFVRAALATSTAFPEAIRHGAAAAGVEVNCYTSDRVAALNAVPSASKGGDRLSVWITIRRAGARSPARVTVLNSEWGGTLSIPAGSGRSSTSPQVRVPLNGLDWSAVDPGADLTLFVEYTIAVRARSGITVAAWTQTDEGAVRVLPAESVLVRTNTDPEVVASFTANAHVRLAPIYLPPRGKRYVDRDGVELAKSNLMTSRLPVGLAGDLVVIHDGRETPICAVTARAGLYMGSKTISWDYDPSAEIDEAMLQSWLEAGSVTVELRPVPAHAEQDRVIREILGVPLRFESVPVTDTPPPAPSFSTDPAPGETIGRPITDPEV